MADHRFLTLALHGAVLFAADGGLAQAQQWGAPDGPAGFGRMAACVGGRERLGLFGGRIGATAPQPRLGASGLGLEWSGMLQGFLAAPNLLGRSSVALPIPRRVARRALPGHVPAAGLDPSAPNGLRTTQGLSIRLGD